MCTNESLRDRSQSRRRRRGSRSRRRWRTNAVAPRAHLETDHGWRFRADSPFASSRARSATRCVLPPIPSRTDGDPRAQAGEVWVCRVVMRALDAQFGATRSQRFAGTTCGYRPRYARTNHGRSSRHRPRGLACQVVRIFRSSRRSVSWRFFHGVLR